MKYAAVFALAFSAAAGLAIGSYIAHALCVVVRNSFSRRKRPVLPVFPR